MWRQSKAHNSYTKLPYLMWSIQYKAIKCGGVAVIVGGDNCGRRWWCARVNTEQLLTRSSSACSALRNNEAAESQDDRSAQAHPHI